MAKIAIFGDSYIARLRTFCKGNLNVPGNVKFFGVGGMRADKVFTEKRFREPFNKLLEFQPDVIFINLGGNDIDSNSTPAEIHRHIMAIVESFHSHGARTVYYQEIGRRGQFKTGVCAEHFEKQRRAVNKKLKKTFVDTFITFQKTIKFPQHFDRDLVHYSHQGMCAYFHGLRRVLLSYKSKV